MQIIVFCSSLVAFSFLGLFVNDFWIADGCVVEQLEKVSFADLCSPLPSEYGYNGNCLLEVYPTSDPAWRLIIGGMEKIMLIEDGEVVSAISLDHPPRYVDYVIAPNLSPKMVLMGYRSLWAGPSAMRLYSFDTGTYFQVIENRAHTTAGDWTSSFSSILGGDCVYFNDVAGFFGGYSEETGHVEYDFTGAGNDFFPGMFPISPIGSSVSDNGSLYVAAMQQMPKEVIGYDLNSGILWKTVCHSSGSLGISANGAFVAVDKFRDGILFLDGRTGQLLDSYLHNCFVTPWALSLSPNGRFIGTTFSAEDSSDYTAGEKYLTCIDTWARDETPNCWDYSDCGLIAPRVTDVADDGALLVKDRIDGGSLYVLLDFEGKTLWKSEIVGSHSIADLASTETGYTIGYIDELLGHAVFIQLALDSI